MRLLFELDAKNYDLSGTVFSRPSVRGIILRGGKIAMVHSLKYGHYKFPGGGLEPGESRLEALCREVREESGLVVIPSSVREYGWVHRIEKGSPEDVFIQDNYYFFCETEAAPTVQRLDDYEAEEGYTLEFIDPCLAIEANRQTDRNEYTQKYRVMLLREARVLEMLMDEGYFSHSLNSE